MSSTKAASAFWKERSCKDPLEAARLHSGPVADRRLQIESESLPSILRVSSADTVLDLGAGTGAAVSALWDKAKFITAVDTNESFLDCINDQEYPNVCTVHSDILSYNPAYEDCILLLGVIQYLIDDDEVVSLLSRCEGHLRRKGRLLIRNSTALDKTHVVDKHVDRFGARYVSKYRSLSDLFSLVEQTHLVTANVLPVLPAHLDSQFGTRQYYILLESSR